MDISPAVEEGLEYAKYIRITDASNKLWFGFWADGYDIDGLILCPSEVKSAFDRLTNARDSTDFTALDWDFNNLEPNEEGEHHAIAMYPNPVSGTDDVKIELYSPEDEEALVQVFDLQGLLVMEERFEVIQGNNELTLRQNLLQGVYLLQYTSGTYTETLKFSKK